MDPGESALGWHEASQARILLALRRLHEDECVLGIVVRDILSRPEERAQAVEGQESSVPKQFNPILRPLLVDVLIPSLMRYGSGEEHCGREPNERINERTRSGVWEMLSHFY
jgi:hypothetical protein